MNTKHLCESILREACDSNIEFYEGMISSQDLDVVTDPLWKAYISIMRALTPEQREVIMAFNRQVAIDAVSTVFGGIDGSTSLAGHYFALSLSDNDGHEHAGNLQETFLEVSQA